MADGIGKIFGNSNFGVGSYVPQRKGEEAPQDLTAKAPVPNKETLLDPSKVMDFLANNHFIAPIETKGGAEVDKATQARVEGYMENFEMIYGVIVKEFGDGLAPHVMDTVMDHIMEMTA